MWTRRQFLTRSALGLGATAGTCFAMSGDNRGENDGRDGRDGAIPDGSASRGLITQDTDAAIARGLEYLIRSRSKRNNGSFGTYAYEGNVAVTSLAALAFMAAGNQPNRGPHGRIVTDALKYVLSQENGDGIRGDLYNKQATPHGPMYGHGFGTLFLSEVSGMVHDKALREEVTKKLHWAVDLIIRSQTKQGGWRYTPNTRESDISVTVCQINALRAARNAGLAVPKGTVDRCVEYIKNLQDNRQGWFKYMSNGGGSGGIQQAFARTAAGVCALFSAGIYKGDAVEKGLDYIMQYPFARGGGGFGRLERPDMHYFYGHYYAVQAMWTAGGDRWRKWYPAIRDELLDHQRQPEGCWLDQICPHYGTAMACIILQIPNNYLPILQK